MVTLLIGKKGTGKTKELIALANEAVAASSGNVVVIEKGLKLTYDISHKARLVDSDAYGIQGMWTAMAIELCVRGLLLLARQIRSKYLHPAIKEATE